MPVIYSGGNRVRAALALAAALVCVLAAGAPLGAQEGGETRVYDARADRWVGWDQAARALGAAHVVFFGEQHGDTLAHRLERALLESLARRGGEVVVSMEMFERDAQPVIDRYLAGEIAEAEMLAAARPWPRYASDYRPLVELARERRWPVVAGNVPRRVAALVAAGTAPDSLPPESRALAAAEVRCPRDAYHQRFTAVMREGAAHGGHGAAAPDSAAAEARAMRYYLAQCLKDETMAESLVRAIRAHRRATVVHFNGAFHSDFHQGVVARTLRRLPAAGVMVLSVVPVPDPATVDPREHRDRADFIVFTRAAESAPGGR